MHAIIYVSTASELLDDEAVSHLLQQSRTRNAVMGVTGILLYSDGSFMQYIEGEEAALTEIYTSIKRDTRHHNLMELLSQPVDKREFPDWFMAYTPISHQDYVELSNADWSAIAEGNSLARELLRGFWTQNRLKKNC